MKKAVCYIIRTLFAQLIISADVADGGMDSSCVQAAIRYDSFTAMLKCRKFNFPPAESPILVAQEMVKMFEEFHGEKDQILKVGLQYSDYINVDDSGARHQGKNGVVTHIGNEAFACFSSTFSKSRINFLELLHAGTPSYLINQHALDYYQTQGLPKEPLRRIQCHLI